VSLRRWILVVSAALGVAVVGTVAYAVWPRRATPFTEEEAVADFRGRPENIASSDGAAGEREVPAEGVYVFSATGGEDVKLGPLPAQSRPYPDVVPVVVVHTEPGCFTVTLNLLDQHTEDTTYCTDGAESLRLDTHVKHQEVGALSPTATMTCDPSRLLGPDAPAHDLHCRLVLSGGPVDLTADVDGVARSSRPVVTQVGGADIDAVRLDSSYGISGDLDGTWEESLWLRASDLLPLRIERDLDLEGLATFEEHSTLVLSDLEPAT